MLINKPSPIISSAQDNLDAEEIMRYVMNNILILLRAVAGLYDD